MVCSTHSDRLSGWVDPVYIISRVVVRKWALVGPMLAFPTTFVINAPFGRFTPSSESIFLFDGECY